MRNPTEAELVEQVRMALATADALGLHDAALHLNEALIALTGVGVAPRETAPAGVH